MSMELDKIIKTFSKQEFIDKIVADGCSKFNINTLSYCCEGVVSKDICRQCITKSIQDIKFKDELNSNKDKYNLIEMVEEMRKNDSSFRDSEFSNITYKLVNGALKYKEGINQSWQNCKNWSHNFLLKTFIKIEQKSVSFEEAYQAWKQGNLISYIHDGEKIYIKRSENFGQKLSLKEFTEDCKWFIEEEYTI